MQVTDTKDIRKYYRALVEKDPSYIGLFYAGVKTTGIFCLPTCRARKPKFENVEFFTEVKDMLQHGYRPCKVCKPTENAHEVPPDIQRAIEMVHERPKEKVKDWQLREEGLQPEKIRRWFQKHYGFTFQAYQRMIRLNNAFTELKSGSSVTHSAFGSGYESLSGFGYTVKQLTGGSPESAKDKDIILVERITSPLGPLYIGATENGICMLEFTDRRMLETEFGELQKRLDAIVLTGSNHHIEQLKLELNEYFNGTRQNFDIELDTPGTDFQRSVWNILMDIPYGTTRSYQQQAELLGRPEAIRAVASANGHNRIAIVIPCHRVIGKNGKLTGYGGGLERKKWLLMHERQHCGKNEAHLLFQ